MNHRAKKKGIVRSCRVRTVSAGFDAVGYVRRYMILNERWHQSSPSADIARSRSSLTVIIDLIVDSDIPVCV